jgi:predicted phage terminase large subunit-like protein
VIPCTPSLDKLTRFAAITPQIEAGRLVLPHHAHWLAAFEAELFSFPETTHDDQIDALSQYLQWHLRREKAGKMQVRRI